MTSDQEQGQDPRTTEALMTPPPGSTDEGRTDREPVDTTDERVTDPLLASDEGSGFQERWKEIQVRFVDEPQTAVHDADRLVAELMQQLTNTFAGERDRLEAEWEQGADVSTEDLRQVLRHYRSFFNRLLAA